MALNIWTGLGRLCYEPELKKTQSGKSVASIRIAVERDIKREGEPTADFFSVAAFDKTAEFICKYFHKGDAIIITGAVQNDDYTDKDGNKRYAVKIFARNASFAGGCFTDSAQDDASKTYREATGQNNASVYGKRNEPAPATSWTPPTPEQPSFMPATDNDDDLPF